MAATITPALEQFTREPVPAVVSTRRKDGSVQLNPVWYDFAGGAFRINGTATRHWTRRLEPGREVSLFVLDPKDMFRWFQVTGRVVEKTAEGADAHIDHLSARYTGNPVYQDHRPGEQRILVKIEPIRIDGTNHWKNW